MSEVDRLFQALTAIHPRSTQVLIARFIADSAGGPGRSREHFAAHFGITKEAADILLWRAASELLAALGLAQSGPEEEHDSQKAAALNEALERSVGPDAAALHSLSQHASELRQRLKAAEEAELASPAYARETWFRRIAIVVVLILSAWFYGKTQLVDWWQQLSAHIEDKSDGGP